MRILITGVPGSGKTTFAQKLSKELSIPHIEVDTLFWSGSDFLEKVESAISKPSWILEGHFTKIQNLVLPHVDSLIWLDPPRFVAHWRLIKRSLTQKRSSLLWGLRDYRKRRQEFQKAYDLIRARGGRAVQLRTTSSLPNT